MKAKETTKTTVRKTVAAKPKVASKKASAEKTKQVRKTVKRTASKAASSKVTKNKTIEAESSNMRSEIIDNAQEQLTPRFKNRLFKLNSECKDSSEYEKVIRNLDCDAKIKSTLMALIKKTKEVGGKVLQIGKIAFEFALKILNKVRCHFPNFSIAIVIALILMVLISSIPFIGWAIGAVLNPLILVVLAITGVARDVIAMNVDKIRQPTARYFCA